MSDQSDREADFVASCPPLSGRCLPRSLLFSLKPNAAADGKRGRRKEVSRAGRSRRPRAQGMGAAGPAAMGAGRPPTVRRQSLQDFLGSRLGRGSEGEVKVN